MPRGRKRSFRNLVAWKGEKVDDIVKTGSEEGFDDSEWGKGEYISQEKKRSMEFVTLFRNLHGDIPEVHPDYTEYKHKTIRINPTSMAYFELLNRMRKIGMFSDMPREVVAQMEREVKGMRIYNHQGSDDLTYPMMVHISVRFLTWWLMGANKHTAVMMRYMTRMDGKKIRLKAARLSVDRGYILEQEFKKALGLLDDDDIQEVIDIANAIEEPDEKDDFDFDGIEDLF